MTVGVHRPPLPMGRSLPYARPARVRPKSFGGFGENGGVSSPGPFAALPPQVDLPALEQEILQRWEADKVFARTLEGSAGRPQWVFYEGPPTANGRPGHAPHRGARFKDVFPRFKTMQGWHVPRRAGWDCHGLPVEIAVEQELGFAGKPDIERYGIAEFNARCRESVRAARRRVHRADPPDGLLGRHVHRLLDDEPQLHRERLVVAQADLRQGPAGRGPPGRPVLPALRHRPVRPRGRPGLRDPRPTRRSTCGCRSPAATWAGKADLLVWTTTPWTLPSNTAVAVHPDVHLRGRAPRRHGRRARRGRRAAAGRRARRGRRGARPHHRPRLGARALPAAVRAGRVPGDLPSRRALRRPRRLRHHRGRHRAGAPVPRLRRRRPRRLPRATACRWSTRSTRPGTSCPTSRWWAGTSSRTPTPRWSRT